MTTIHMPIAPWVFLTAAIVIPLLVGLLVGKLTKNDDIAYTASALIAGVMFGYQLAGKSPHLPVHAKVVDNVVIMPNDLGATARISGDDEVYKLEIVADGKTNNIKDRFDQLKVKTASGKPVNTRLENVAVEDLRLTTYETDNILVEQTQIVADVTISDADVSDNHTSTLDKLFGDNQKGDKT